MRQKLFLIAICILSVLLSASDIDILKAYNIKNETIDLTILPQPQFIVFYHWYACHDCYKNLKAAIYQYDSTARISVIIRCNNEISSRRSSIAAANNLIKASQYYFDIHEVNDKQMVEGFKDGLFGKFRIIRSPTLLVLKNGRYYFFKFDELFGKGNDKIDIKSLLIKKFKKK